jgi:uncharacterized membrane protein YfcA
MEFSKEERRMIERLRKQQRSWRSGRWFMLGSGVLSLGLGVAGLVIVVPFLQRASDAKTESAVAAAFMLALFHPMIMAFICIAVVTLYCVIRDWQGDSTRTLLLRLIDDRMPGVTDDDVA